ncbi:MAG TPA: phosphopyruvate hydratase [Candidatus Pacebacteria bacterium]|nr:phosphopyruvate hydratase [Candidatus Paceibacterota bacterium]
MATIQALTAKEILDSLGIPTLEVTLWLDSGAAVVTSVATGTSTGQFETTDLRDNDSARMVGRGVLQAVNHINQTIAPALIGRDPTDQAGLDQLLLQLDDSPRQSKLGGNTLIAVSQAILKAGALSQNWPIYYYLQQKYQLTQNLTIPTCIFCMIDGGVHGSDNLDFQEFQIIPASFIDYPSALNLAVTLYQKLEEVLVNRKAVHATGTLGGFTPNLMTNSEVFDVMIEAIKATPYIFSQDVFFGLDASANNFYYGNRYHLKDKSQAYSSKELMEYYRTMRQAHKVIYLEDPFNLDDTKNWLELTAELGSTTSVSSDSLTDSNSKRITEVSSKKFANTFVLKPSKQATITELLLCVSAARQAGNQIVIAHRSGETNDDLVADLAVGIGANFAKFGPVNRQERLAKYNRLSQIHQEIVNRNAVQTTLEVTVAPIVAATPEVTATPTISNPPV